MAEGMIKKLIPAKGFGFIGPRPDDRSWFSKVLSWFSFSRPSGEYDFDDIFFHSSGLENASFEELQEGQSVEFELGDGPKGPRAENIRVV